MLTVTCRVIYQGVMTSRSVDISHGMWEQAVAEAVREAINACPNLPCELDAEAIIIRFD